MSLTGQFYGVICSIKTIQNKDWKDLVGIGIRSFKVSVKEGRVDILWRDSLLVIINNYCLADP